MPRTMECRSRPQHVRNLSFCFSRMALARATLSSLPAALRRRTASREFSCRAFFFAPPFFLEMCFWTLLSEEGIFLLYGRRETFVNRWVGLSAECGFPREELLFTRQRIIYFSDLRHCGILAAVLIVGLQ